MREAMALRVVAEQCVTIWMREGARRCRVSLSDVSVQSLVATAAAVCNAAIERALVQWREATCRDARPMPPTSDPCNSCTQAAGMASAQSTARAFVDHLLHAQSQRIATRLALDMAAHNAARVTQDDANADENTYVDAKVDAEADVDASRRIRAQAQQIVAEVEATAVMHTLHRQAHASIASAMATEWVLRLLQEMTADDSADSDMAVADASAVATTHSKTRSHRRASPNANKRTLVPLPSPPLDASSSSPQASDRAKFALVKPRHPEPSPSLAPAASSAPEQLSSTPRRQARAPVPHPVCLSPVERVRKTYRPRLLARLPLRRPDDQNDAAATPHEDPHQRPHKQHARPLEPPPPVAAQPPPKQQATTATAARFLSGPERLGRSGKPIKRSGYCQQCIFEGRSCKIADCLKHQLLLHKLQ